VRRKCLLDDLVRTALQRSAQVFLAVKLIGALYLVILGVQAIRHRKSLATTMSAAAGSSDGWRALRDGLVAAPYLGVPLRCDCSKLAPQPALHDLSVSSLFSSTEVPGRSGITVRNSFGDRS
jgi:hypothetical protein